MRTISLKAANPVTSDLKKYMMVISSLFLLLYAFAATAKELTNEQISQAYYKSYNYEKAGNYTDAIKALQLVYNEYSKAYGVNNRLGYLYRLNAQYKNAESHYKQAIAALPDAMTPKLGLMYVYLQAQNYDEASKLGYQILNVDFYNYYGNLRLAYVLRMTGKLDLAEKILLKMLTLYPSDVLYLTEFGLLKYQQKDFERTRLVMNSVLILDPENVDARSVLQALEK